MSSERIIRQKGRFASKLSDEQKREIYEKFKQNVSRKDLSTQYEVSIRIIYNIIRDFKLKEGIPSKKLSDEQKREIYEKFKQNVPQKHLSTQYNVSTRTISSIIRDFKLKEGIPSSPKLSNEQKREIYEKYKQNVSRKDICTEFEIPTSTCSRIIRNFKLEERQVKNPKGKKPYTATKFQSLDIKLCDWCEKQKKKEIIITWNSLRNAAREIMKDTEGPKKLNPYLWSVVNYYEMQIKLPKRRKQLKLETDFLKYRLKKCIKIDEELFNWLLERITLGDINKNELNSLLRNEINKLPLKHKAHNIYVTEWVEEFKKCHEILINFVTLPNFEEGDETNLKTKNIENCEQYTTLEKQLFKWLIEQKKSGRTISHAMLRHETLKLMIDDIEKLKIEEENWLWKIGQRYFLPDTYTFKTFRIHIRDIKKKYECNQFVRDYLENLKKNLEKGDLNEDNMYYIVKTQLPWRSYVDALIQLLRNKEINIKQVHTESMTPIDTIFCVHLADRHKFSPYFIVNKNENQSSEEITAKEMTDFEIWYNNTFKTTLRCQRSKEDINNKVFVYVDHCMEYILSENIKQNEDFKIKILPEKTISFFSLLYSMRKLRGQLYKYIKSEREAISSIIAEELDEKYNEYICESIINVIWNNITKDEKKELWKTFLEQHRMKQFQNTPLTTAEFVEYLIKVHTK